MPESSVKTSGEVLAYRSPTRPRRSFSLRLRGSARSWARHTFSRDSLMSSLRTFLWVVPLTVLIWVYAEREELGPPEKVTFKFQLVDSEPGRLVRVVEMIDGKPIPIEGSQVTAEITGPHARLEKVAGQLIAGDVQIPAPRLDPGVHPLQANFMADAPIFKSNGITFNSIMPAELTVLVDPMKSVEVEVQPSPEERDSLAKVEFEPRKVQISMPESFARDHPKVTAYANLTDLTTPGAHQEDATISPSVNDPHVTLSMVAVHAVYTVKNKNVAGVIPSVPVWPTIPPLPNNYWGTHHVEIAPGFDTIREVNVVGPPDVVQKLQDRTPTGFPIKATFDVSATDGANAAGGYSTAQVHIELPGGVRLTDEHLTVQYKIAENKPPDQ